MRCGTGADVPTSPSLRADEVSRTGNGILVQLPLPLHIDRAPVLARVDPKKHVDGFHVVNAGKLAVGDAASCSARPWAACFF